MKWFMIFIFRSVSVFGPFDTREKCLEMLKTEIDTPRMIDRGFDHTDPFGLCFKGIMPYSKSE